jgi:hypothetical protein
MATFSSPQTFGEFEIPSSENKEYLTLQFSPTFGPRQQRWRNYGLSADFLGDYFATFFPGSNQVESPINQRDTVKGAVSYIANELLENAIKYTDESVVQPIVISLFLQAEQITFRVTNYTDADTAQRYMTFVQTLTTTADLDALYTHQLEQAALGSGHSQMGLLTMMSDYQARFAWQFQASAKHPGAVSVDVLAHLSL